MAKAKILIIDDEKNAREGLKRALKSEYDVSLADNGKRGMELILEDSYELVLTDLRMPEMDGMEFIHRLQALDNPPGCILMTAYGNLEVVKDAMRAGAIDYIEKPITDIDQLDILIEKSLTSKRLKAENTHLKRELASRYAFENIIGNSPKMVELLDTVKQIASARSTVLLTGENGTGKSMFARYIHQRSHRSHKDQISSVTLLRLNILSLFVTNDVYLMFLEWAKNEISTIVR